MRAVITIEDDDQAIKMNVIYEGTEKDPGFCVGSNAHQHATVLLKIMDAMLEKREATGDTHILTGDELVAEISHNFDRVAQAERASKIDLSQVPDDSPLFQPEKDTKIRIAQLTVVSH